MGKGGGSPLVKLSRNQWLPLVDLFRNKKVEIDVDLGQLKTFVSVLNLPQSGLIPTV